MKLRRIVSVPFIILTLAFACCAQNIPAGTRIRVRTTSEISSARARSGQAFDATLADDLVVNGQTVAKAGAPVRGKVSYSKKSGRLHSPGILTLRLASVDQYSINSTAISRKGKSHTKSNATKIGGGAAAGTVIGALAGGGAGALIGAAAGGAAGTGVAALTGKQEAVFPSESMLAFSTIGTAHKR